MGLVRSFLLNFIVGPLIVYVLLLAHVAYQAIKEPAESEGSGQTWPSTISQKEKEAIIASRQTIIKDVTELMKGKNLKFCKVHVTEDVQLENPIHLIVGVDECNSMSQMWSAMLENAEIKTKNVVHAPHEIILDQTITFKLKTLPMPSITIDMKNHLLLEPSTSTSTPEKMFRYYEEWNNNPHLNEKTFSPAIVGRLHQKLRRFHGFLTATTYKTLFA